jgi:hypothetical protein
MAEIRLLTNGERNLLRPIFGETLPYNDQLLTVNDSELGGRTNSITTRYIPAMAVSIWTFDFSSAPADDKWIFIHEMTHAWQWYHGRNLIWNAVRIWGGYKDYEEAYNYNLDDSDSLTGFNIEQQASIVADYWYVTLGVVPQHNKGMRAELQAYLPYIMQLKASGPGKVPYVDHDQDWRLQRHGP